MAKGPASPRPLASVLLAWTMAAVVVTACGAVPGPTPTLASLQPSDGPSDRAITAVDPRLMPALLAIAQHPDWAPGPVGDLNAHRALPSLDELCVEVMRPGLLPLYVTVGVESVPWEVMAVSVFDPATDEAPQMTYDSGDPDSQHEICEGVLIGSREPFPAESGAIEVNGPVQDPAQARALAAAIFEEPEAFGIDRSSRPAINLMPLNSADDGRVCYTGIVYQSGPRAGVTITLRRVASEWLVHHVRVTRQALNDPEEPPEGAC